MIQEYLAFGTFLGALVLAFISLVKFFRNQLKRKENFSCNSNCHCKSERNNALHPHPLRIKNNQFIKPLRTK